MRGPRIIVCIAAGIAACAALMTQAAAIPIVPKLKVPSVMPAPLRLYVFAGQSNMIDWATNTRDLSSIDPTLRYQPNVRFWGPTEDTIGKYWAPLAAPDEVIHVASGSGFGPELGTAQVLARRHPETTVAIVKLTRGATTLANDWNPVDGSMYPLLIDEVRSAETTLRAETGRAVVVAGFFWLQGESDGRSAADADAYELNLTTFINRFRVDVQSPRMPFVIGEIPDISAHYPDYPYDWIVQNAERNVPQHVPFAYYVPSQDLPMSTFSPAHFTSLGIIELGRRFAASNIPL